MINASGSTEGFCFLLTSGTPADRSAAMMPGQTPWSVKVVRYALLSTCLVMPNLDAIIQRRTRLWPFTLDLKPQPPPSLITTKPLEKRDIMMCKLRRMTAQEDQWQFIFIDFFCIPGFSKHFWIIKEEKRQDGEGLTCSIRPGTKYGHCSNIQLITGWTY